MQLLLALALLFVAHAQNGYEVTKSYNGSCDAANLAIIEAIQWANESDCLANAENPCTFVVPVAKRFFAVADNEVTCINASDAGPTTGFAGYYRYDNEFCNGTLLGWVEYRDNECIQSEGTLRAQCVAGTTWIWSGYANGTDCDAGGPSTSNETWPQDCTAFTVNNETTEWRTSTCPTPAPTNAPTNAPTEATTEAPTGAPTEPSVIPDDLTIYDVKAFCKDNKDEFNEELTAGVADATGVADADCTVSGCAAVEDYTAAQFKWDCKGDFNETTAELICPALSAAFFQPGGFASVCKDIGGNPRGTKGTLVISPLPAAGAFLSTSFFMFVALILANLF